MPRSAPFRPDVLRACALALSGALLLVLALVGWSCRPGPACGCPRPPVITMPMPYPVPTAAPAPAPKPVPPQLTVVGCSHGSVGVSAVGHPQPHWVIATVHLRAGHALRHLRLASMELLDKSNKVIARSARAEAIRIGKPQVTYPDGCLPHTRPRPQHLSPAGTRPFDGHLSPLKRHRLWLHVRMAGDYFRAARARPVRCRITLNTANGKALQATATPVGTWPTG